MHKVRRDLAVAFVIIGVLAGAVVALGVNLNPPAPKVVYVDRPVEKVVEVPKIITEYVDRPVTVEKPVVVEKTVEVPVTAKFQLGDDLPFNYSATERLDCDDFCLYAYIFFESSGYPVEVRYGDLSGQGTNYWTYDHWWVIAYSENGTAYPYDLGYCMQNNAHLGGMKMTYQDLLRSALRD